MKKFVYKTLQFITLILVAVLMVQCGSEAPADSESSTASTPTATIIKAQYGSTPDGQAVDQYTLKNESGMEIKVITYGGIITSWTAPDKNGQYENIALGFDSLAHYIEGNPFFGALVGRYGNRIAKASFTLDNQTYQLETNNGANHLHGGTKGFDKVIWAANEEKTNNGVSLKLTYTSPDGEGGYPGNLNTTVIYTLNNDNALEVSYEAVTDKKTIVNLTQHTYFNLSGDFSENILDHVLTINADQYLPVDDGLIPIGELRPVEGTPFDFRKPKPIGEEIEQNNEQLTIGKGYDHCWVLNEPGSFRKIATALHPASGRVLEVFSTEPGVQFYTGNFLNGTRPIPGGGTYGHRSGFCLETQHFPDSPNQDQFPSVVLEPGEKYQSKTTFKFSTE